MCAAMKREVSAFTVDVGGQPVDIEDSAAVKMCFDNCTLGTHTSVESACRSGTFDHVLANGRKSAGNLRERH